jgi:tetratricopeptide (TPR) repeat protein
MNPSEAGRFDRHSLSATQVEVLDRACDQFEAALRAGKSARIEDHVGEAEGPFRSALLSELIALDIDWRQRLGKNPAEAVYRDRFPGHTDAVAAAFARAGAGPFVGEAGRFPFKQVVSLCEDFTKEWEQRQRPEIPSYLLRAADDVKETLLFNLLQNEIQRRRLVGESPRADEYIEQLPGYSSLIRKVFLDSTSLGSGLPGDAGTCASQSRPLVADRLGDYRLVRELGRGGMGVVFEAVHVNRGNRVALKMLPRVDGAQLYRFKREFRSAADISHPNLIGLYTLESDGGQWFFTMDLIEGVDFLDYVRPSDRLDETRLRSAFAQLAMGVMALHRHHIIHRDLKPSNVMVSDDGRVILLDFGLVVELEQSGMTQSTDKIAGTPAYMAPEQAAATAVTPACDWYAVGVMLYEALSGTRPFGGSLWEILRDKQQVDPPPLPQDPASPHDLAAFCMRLLARDPAERPDALQITRQIASGLASAPVAHAAIGGPHLVGREPHLARLRDAYRVLRRDGVTQTVFVSGRSGEGKTTLAEHFLGSLRQDKSVAVMGGRCYDRESVPFKALDALIDALASYLRGLTEADAARLMPDDIAVLARVFPVLNRVQVVAEASAGRTLALDEQQMRQRAFAALRALLLRISRRSPVVWFVDDLQWGDADSAEALFETLRPPDAPQVLFIGTYRSDEALGSPFLRDWKGLQHKHNVHFADIAVTLAPLTPEECTELVIDLLGEDTEVIRRRALEFAKETGGNPFLLIELVGCFDPHTDSFRPMPIHELLERKLEQLPPDAAPLLDVVAVSGQALALEEAWRAAGLEAEPVSTLSRMRTERLVRLVGSEHEPRVDTYHDKIRETVLAVLEDPARKRLHGNLAGTIEQAVGGGVTAEQMAGVDGGRLPDVATGMKPRVYDLAFHFDAAGDRARARAYAMLAAEQARRQFALEVAVNNYAMAERNLGAASNDLRYRLAEGFAESLALLGRYESAEKSLEGAIDLVGDAERKARLDLLQGDIRFKQGQVAQSAAIYENGLRRLGVWVPRSQPGLMLGLLGEGVVQAVHSLLPFLLHRKAPSERRFLVNRLFHLVGRSYIFSSTPKLMWGHFSEINRSERLAPSLHLAMCYGVHSGYCSMLGWASRGARYGERSLAMARPYDDVLGLGYRDNYQGIGLYASARYEKGLACLTEAIAAFEKAGDLYEWHLAHFHRGCCHFGLGNLADAVAEARWTFASSARLGDSRTLCSSYLWARATRGNFPFEELRGCYPCRPDDVMSTVHGIMAEGHWHTFHGRTAEALQAFERAGAMVKRSLCVNSHTILAIPNLAAALRRHAETMATREPRQSDELLRRAEKLARWATKITSLFAAAYPVALRERALILAARGKLKRALKFADKSCTVALVQKAKYEHALSLQVRGQIARILGLPEADEQIRSAEAAIEAIERPLGAAIELVKPPSSSRSSEASGRTT